MRRSWHPLHSPLTRFPHRKRKKRRPLQRRQPAVNDLSHRRVDRIRFPNPLVGDLKDVSRHMATRFGDGRRRTPPRWTFASTCFPLTPKFSEYDYFFHHSCEFESGAILLGPPPPRQRFPQDSGRPGGRCIRPAPTNLHGVGDPCLIYSAGDWSRPTESRRTRAGHSGGWCVRCHAYAHRHWWIGGPGCLSSGKSPPLKTLRTAPRCTCSRSRPTGCRCPSAGCGDAWSRSLSYKCTPRHDVSLAARCRSRSPSTARGCREPKKQRRTRAVRMCAPRPRGYVCHARC
ncbi:hypothetical protein B0H14DRAFT_804651 [Mycena olivaceomarginata]|nr:hypothetical protein B0H14DRAFT_804651 [Mycena olivaceomarginata]